MTDIEQPDTPRSRRRRWILFAVAVVLAGATAPLLISLLRLERVGVDREGARERLDAREPEVVVNSPSPSPEPEPAPTSRDDDYRSFLVIGSDERSGLAGSRADVLIMGLLPADGTDPIMFSLPRDLWLPDPCRGGHQRINAAYNGCGDDANGLELTSIVVEDFTGIAVDHVASVDFEGFKQVIDAVGGVEICVDNPVRDGSLRLPAGCTMAGGDQALAWVRSRHTQELVDGEWRAMPGVNDLTRNRRQQALMLQLLGRVGSFETVSHLYSFAQGVSDSVTLGSSLSLLDGVRLAWSLRDEAGNIRRFSIPVEDMRTSDGAQVLLPAEPFSATFERELGRSLVAGGE